MGTLKEQDAPRKGVDGIDLSGVSPKTLERFIGSLLALMGEAARAESDAPMSEKQAARHLNKSVRWVQERARRGELVGSKAGRGWRFRKADLDAFLERMRRTGAPSSAAANDTAPPLADDVAGLAAELGLEAAVKRGRR